MTPAGSRGHGRPRRRQSAEEAPGPPHGKQVPGAEINRPVSMDNLLINIGIMFRLNEKLPRKIPFPDNLMRRLSYDNRLIFFRKIYNFFISN